LKNALRKIIADNSAGVIFNLLNLFDGTATPKNYNSEWSGLELLDVEENKDDEPFCDTLHDKFFETYWNWKKIRNNKSWKLDTYEE
jgi:hypothetical protein